MRTILLKFGIILAAALILNACNKSEAVSIPYSPMPDMAAAPARMAEADGTIRFLEERIKSDPEDFIAYNKLASEYLQKVRETGDITFLNLALKAANSSLRILPAEQNKGGLVALAQAEYSSHDFTAARDHALQLTKLDPSKGFYYQMLGDAMLELGQYVEAESAYKQMKTLGGIQGLTLAAMQQRLARLALLHGDNKAAAKHFSAALRLAEALPTPPQETVAWCRWQLGETAFAEGDYALAERYYRSSLETLPDYFRSVASLGRVLAAQADISGAIEQFEKVVKILPDPNFIAALGDLYMVAGRESDAETQYALVEQIGLLSSASGALYNRQLSLFRADHDIKAEEAYLNAAKEYEVRRDIYGADAVAWTAYKAGKLTEAHQAMGEALRLGTRDARLFYHAGMIENGLGNQKEVRKYLELALKISPAFDPIQAAKAKSALEGSK
jgi:tetratricopeptide (TPR) repeat protein